MPLFPVYSIGKTLAAAAVLALGHDLDAPVGDLVDLPASLHGARLRDVLRHRAGLPDYGAWPDYAAAIAGDEPWSFDELMARTDRAGGVARPSGFRYSNIGYAIVRRMLEHTHQADFFDVVRSAVLDPLGITEIAPFAEPGDWARCAPSQVDVSWYHPGWVLTGTIAASPSAIEAAMRGILAGALFDPARMLDTRAVDAPGTVLDQPGYGLGLMTSGCPTPRWAGHGGAGPGYTTFVLADADGSAAKASFVPAEVDQNDLIRECLAGLPAGDDRHPADGVGE
ncbi:serine hydrolase domain-containing protein [Microbacterium terricola]|uniref:Beta-lactamase-related domain-containing protein n=1 Tax=Microbacterium terricola TaxID=344163 RepID=A0ABM8E1R6_9MICO|nr:serine hydrolase domain-containing protein [Microbacterium terricola]UYK40542.1 beta-lactamase family protein [Microbacterium terricola]BDV31732.1 hypothetical protein Microterr_23920 [Microbacterium terricola]